ncbi:MAG TPA: response regulator [Actinomycetota bacterium]|nr:response regulator [Actinomycetota bacterium]
MTDRILVVDDEPDLRLLVRMTLEGNGYDVEEASTAAEAIRQALAVRPRLILLDIRLPDAEGFEVLKTLKATPELAATPVVMMSAHSSPPTLRKAEVIGSNDYLIKPFKQDALLALVRKHLAAP